LQEVLKLILCFPLVVSLVFSWMLYYKFSQALRLRKNEASVLCKNSDRIAYQVIFFIITLFFNVFLILSMFYLFNPNSFALRVWFLAIMGGALCLFGIFEFVYAGTRKLKLSTFFMNANLIALLLFFLALVLWEKLKFPTLDFPPFFLLYFVLLFFVKLPFWVILLHDKR
jgi:hypothetical protein